MTSNIGKVTHILSLVLFFASALASEPQDDNLLTLDNSSSVYSKTASKLSFFIDHSKSKTLSDISHSSLQDKFVTSAFSPPVFKKSESIIWGRLVINNLALEVQHYLFYDYYQIYKLQLFTPGKNNTLNEIQAGQYFQAENQSLHKRHIIIPLELSQGQNIIYFRLEHPIDTLHFNLLIADAIGIAELSAQNVAEISIYIALLTAFFLFNMIIYLVIRDKAYLFYSMHVLFIGLYFAAFYGFPFTWLDLSPYYNGSVIANILSQVAGIFSILFFLRFIRVRERSEKMYRFFYLIIYAVLANIILMLSGWQFALELWLLILAIGSVSQLGFVFRYVNKDPYCVFYAIAWGLHLSIIILYILSAAEVSETHIRNGHIMFGSIIELLILTFALGYRFTRILKEKEVIEQQVHQVLEREDSLVQLSYQDPLTGTYNRRKFDEVLLQKIQHANSEQTTFSLIIIDIDFFKNINDQHGHETGDKVLKAFTAIMPRLIRKSDTFCRIGGEEFSIILDTGDIADATALAEKIRQTVEHEPVLEQKISITISCGVTIFQQDDNTSSLMQRADEALYHAKNTGRNKVVTTGSKNQR